MTLDAAVTPPRKKEVELSSLGACPEGRGGPGGPGFWPGAGMGGATAAGVGAEPGAAAGAWVMDVLPTLQLISDMVTFCPVGSEAGGFQPALPEWKLAAAAAAAAAKEKEEEGNNTREVE